MSAILLPGCGGRKRTLVRAPAVDAAQARPERWGTDLPPSLFRVGLSTGQRQLQISLPGPCWLLGGDHRERLARLAGGTVVVRPAPDGVRWQAAGRSGQTAHLHLQPVDPRQFLRWADTPYRGELLVVPRQDGLTLVNVLELESYLRGVVPWEIGRHGPDCLAALSAQAVAARTYTVAHRGERAAFGFDLWADVQDQVYRGAGAEDSLCNLAIAATAGRVLRQGGREIEAYYCSTCGGRTSNVEQVWPRPARPYLRSRPDSLDGQPHFCSASPRYAWTEVWTRPELERVLATSLPAYLEYMSTPVRAAWAGVMFTPASRGSDPGRPGRLHGLRIVQRTESGRVGLLDLHMDSGIYHVRGDRVRWVLAPPGGQPAILWSALFSLTISPGGDGRPERIVARGRGAGHGVGMCQHGALGMARLGYTFQQILSHYYPGTRLESLQE